MSNKNIAIIPARGGSKRLPRKNILKFLDRPIIHYTIEAAKQSKLFDAIVVSTEDDEVKKCVEAVSCEIHHRDLELSTDVARVVSVIKAVLNYYGNMHKTFDYLCCLYPTAPLRDAEDICNSYNIMLSKKADYCLAVTEYPYSPFFAFDLMRDCKINRRWPDLFKLPPWEKPKVVVDNGSIYWAKATSFFESGELEGKNAVGYMMPRLKSVDIDTIEDFELAEFIATKFIR